MTASSDDETGADAAGAVVDAVVAAIESVPGLHPAVPAGVDIPGWIPRLGPHAAVDLDSETVEVRVTSSALPLPPLLERLAGSVQEALSSTRWSAARLRLVVTDLEPDAFDNQAFDNH